MILILLLPALTAISKIWHRMLQCQSKVFKKQKKYEKWQKIKGTWPWGIFVSEFPYVEGIGVNSCKI